MVQRTKFYYLSFVIALIVFILTIFFAIPTSFLAISTNIAVYAIFFSALAFVTLFSIWSNWWENPAGWTLVILDMGLLLSTAPAVLHLFLGVAISQSVFFARYYIVSLSLAAIGVIWRTWIMMKHNIIDKVRKFRGVGKNRKSKAGSFKKISEA